jgi:hypothetical protein
VENVNVDVNEDEHKTNSDGDWYVSVLCAENGDDDDDDDNDDDDDAKKREMLRLQDNNTEFGIASQ